MEKATRESASDTVNKELEKVRDRVRTIAEDTWEDVTERGEKALAQVRDRGEDLLEDAEKLVRKYPSKAIGIALLAGTIVGAFLAFSRKDD